MHAIVQRLLVWVFALVLFSASALGQRGEVVSFQLPNGARVIVEPVPQGRAVAMVAHFGVGDMHDPAGASGLSHLVEHLFVTAGAGAAQARTAQELMALYNRQHTAQTAADFTVIGCAFPPQRLEGELADLAARMGALRITDLDLAREKPRMAQELGNMFGGFPGLAALNHARLRVSPGPEGQRRGGIEAEIDAITTDRAIDWHSKYYQPANLVLAVVGPVDPQAVKVLAEKWIGPLKAGEVPPPVRQRAQPRVGGEPEIIEVPALAPELPAAMSAPVASIAYAVPEPGDEGYPAYLVLLGSIMGEARQAGMFRPGALPPPIFVSPLDEPTTFALSRAVAGDPADEFRAMREFLASAVVLDDARLASARSAVVADLGPMLGLSDPPPQLALVNPYPLALAHARRVGTGLDTEALRAAVNALSAAEVSAWGERIFGPKKGAAVVVMPRPAQPAQPATPAEPDQPVPGGGEGQPAPAPAPGG